MSTHPTPVGPSLPAGPAPPAGLAQPAGPVLRAESTPSAGPTLSAVSSETRASDADRDAAAGLLNEAFAEGRLTADEHGQRLSAAYAARSWQELHQLTADLPAPSGAADLMMPPASAGVDPCLLCVLLIVCPPAGVAYWLLSRRRPPVPPAATRGQVGMHAQDR